MSLEAVGKYIGPNEIVSIEQADFKTPGGKDILKVTFKSGRHHIYSKETLERIVTDALSDETTVMEKKLMPVVQEVMNILAEHDINVGEIEMLFKQLGMNIDKAFNQATSYMWFKEPKEFVPGFDPMHNVSLLMAERVLKDVREHGQGN